MTSLTLIEYWKHVDSDYEVSGNTFIFDPNPRNVSKDVEVKWRIRRPGLHRKLERARFRYNETIEFTLTGSCNTSKRDQLEWFAKRDSIFKLQNCTMKTMHAEQTDDSDWPAYQYWSQAQNEDCGEGAGQGEPVYVVIENAKFTQTEAKLDWYDYTVKLRRVSLTRH